MARTACYSVPPTTTTTTTTTLLSPRSSSVGDMPTPHTHPTASTQPGWSAEQESSQASQTFLHVTVPSVRQDRGGWPRASSA